MDIVARVLSYWIVKARAALSIVATAWWLRRSLRLFAMLVSVSLFAAPVLRESSILTLCPNALVVKWAPDAWTPTPWIRTGRTTWGLPQMSNELKRRALVDELSPEDWLAAFRAAGVLRAPASISRGKPLTIGLCMPYDWVGFGEITLTPRTPGLLPAKAGRWRGNECAFAGDFRRATEAAQVIGVVPDATTAIEFDVTLRRAPSGAHSWTEPPPVYLGVWRHEIRVVDGAFGE
jgi:hypothetical protein